MATKEKEKLIYQFQVEFMLNPELNMNKASKEQVKINLENSFSGTTMTPVRKVLKKGTLVLFHFWCFKKTYIK